MKGLKTTIEKNIITNNLTHKIMIAPNEERLFLVVDFMKGKFIIEKIFLNNYFGLENLNSVIKTLDSEIKVIEYLKIDGKTLNLGDSKNGK